MARGERSKKPIFQNTGPEAYCPNVTGRARISPLKSKSKRGELTLTLNIMVEDHVFPVRALVDTGTEVNITRRGVLPENFLQKDSHPLNLRRRMRPNSRVVICVLGEHAQWKERQW